VVVGLYAVWVLSVIWIIKYHLLLSRRASSAFRYDCSSPRINTA
jgi:hypothetical protein